MRREITIIRELAHVTRDSEHRYKQNFQTQVSLRSQYSSSPTGPFAKRVRFSNEITTKTFEIVEEEYFNHRPLKKMTRQFKKHVAKMCKKSLKAYKRAEPSKLLNLDGLMTLNLSDKCSHSHKQSHKHFNDVVFHPFY